ncbi:MAG TPA: hypothetical protein VMV81_13915 [Phycisphaerae bacterium]|nr:hypothetical protein [Phycisphaerae bacterium]
MKVKYNPRLFACNYCAERASAKQVVQTYLPDDSIEGAWIPWEAYFICDDCLAYLVSLHDSNPCELPFLGYPQKKLLSEFIDLSPRLRRYIERHISVRMSARVNVMIDNLAKVVAVAK